MADTATKIKEALEALSKGYEITAGDILIFHFEDLLCAHDFQEAAHMLEQFDTNSWPPKILSSLMMASGWAWIELDLVRVDFMNRCKVSMAEKWGLTSELIESTMKRHHRE